MASGSEVLLRSVDRTAATTAADAAAVTAMKTIRALVALVVVETAVLVMIGAVIQLAAAAWQFLTGGTP
jgi:flavin-binding protein dodecin